MRTWCLSDACSVPVSEIITVEEQDVHGKRSASGKWQKMERLYAFTGDAARLTPPGLRDLRQST